MHLCVRVHLIATVAKNLTVFAHQHIFLFGGGGGGKGTSQIKKMNEKEGESRSQSILMPEKEMEIIFVPPPYTPPHMDS